jgi:eukaryotic-like serine/threonine-protein kinase
MSDEILRRWPETSRLLDELLALDSDARRERIATLVATDPALAPVLSALATDTDGVDEPLMALPLDLRFDDDVEGGLDLGDGERIGPYRVLDEIGRGGMARVYRAVEVGAADPTPIALKVLEVASAAPGARQRFDREQRTLARLHHPHIARWLNAGVTDEGRAWLAMTLVEGLPIDRYCDAKRLSIDDRLGLFLDICRAVEYAHGFGIVHRDLKPSNILVDRTGCVRLLDFGIAKCLAAIEGVAAAHSDTLTGVLTPAYAAPEQFESGKTTPATDVYQLGLLLFELLIGVRAAALPRDPRDRGGVTTPPSRVAIDPSVDAAEDCERRAAARSTTPAALAQRLTGALDDIVLRATRRRRDVRYPSVAALRDAVEGAWTPAGSPEPRTAAGTRWLRLRGSPVSAALLAGALLALVGGLVAFGLQARANEAAELRSRARLASIALEKGGVAEARAALPAIVAAQTAALGRAHPDTLWSRAWLGGALRQAGQPTASTTELASALQDARGLPVDQWRVHERLLRELIDAELTLSRGLSAEAHARELVDLVLARAGPDGPAHVEALLLLARAHTVLLKYSDAIAAQEKVVGLHERLYGPAHASTGGAWLSLGTAYSRFARDQDAARAIGRAHAILRETLGADHPDTVKALRNLGVSSKYAGDLPAAERSYREVLAIRQRTLGPLHRDTLEAGTLVQLNVGEQGRLAEARTLGRTLINQYEAVILASKVDPLVLDDYALLLHQIDPPDLRNPARSVAIAERAVADTRRQDYARLRTLAHALRAAGRDRDALATAREALALPPALQSWTLEQLVVDLLTALGAPGEKEAWLLDRLAQFSRLGRPDDFLAGTTLRHLAETSLAAGRVEEAEARYRQALAQMRKTGPDSHWQVGRIKSDLGAIVAKRRDFREAETLLVEGYRTLVADRVVRRTLKERAKTRLVELYAAMGRPAEAERWRREAIP